MALSATQEAQAARYRVTIERGESPYSVIDETGTETKVLGQYGHKDASFEMDLPPVDEYENLLDQLALKNLSLQEEEKINTELENNIIHQINEDPENEDIIAKLQKEIDDLSRPLWGNFFSEADVVLSGLTSSVSKLLKNASVPSSCHVYQPSLNLSAEQMNDLFQSTQEKDEKAQVEYINGLNDMVLLNLTEAFRQAVYDQNNEGDAENEEYGLTVTVKRIDTETL